MLDFNEIKLKIFTLFSSVKSIYLKRSQFNINIIISNVIVDIF